MDERSAGFSRYYSRVHASDSSKVIAGDYNIQMHRPVFYISYSHSCDNKVLPSVLCGLREQFPPKPMQSFASSSSGDEKPTEDDVQIHKHGCRSHGCSEQMQPITGDIDGEGIRIGGIRAASAEVIAASASSVRNEPMSKRQAVRSGLESRQTQHTCQQSSLRSTTERELPQRLPQSTAIRCQSNAERVGGGHHRDSDTTLHTSIEAQTVISFQDDLAKPSTLNLREYRIFFLRRKGSDWTQSTCSESMMPMSQISDRIKHGPRNSRRKKQNISWTIDNLSPERKRIVEIFLREINRYDLQGRAWSVVAIDNENAKFTKRTGEVEIFSVIVATS